MGWIVTVVDDRAGGAAGVEDGMIGVLDTWAIEVRGGVDICMKRGAIDGFVFAFCPLINDSIVDQEVVNVFGCLWSGISANEDKGVMTGVARFEVHPLAS